jgi:hypothetical protein
MATKYVADSTEKAQEISRLKYHYYTASNRKYHTPEHHDALADHKSAKDAPASANQAAQRENQAFIERLRDRMTELGVGKEEIKQAENTAPAMPYGMSKQLAKGRTAILVIHGIGEQNPYETLDQFGRNLMRYLSFEGGINDLQISADRYDHNDSIEARIRLTTQNFGPQQGGGRPGLIDIYEYYWAPQTEDKISYKETLSWLIKTTLTPIRFLNENVQAIANTRENVSDGKSQVDESDEPLTQGAIFRREILRITWIYLPLLFVLGSMFYFLPKAVQIPAAITEILEIWNRQRALIKILFTLMTFCFSGVLVLNFVVVRQLWKNWLRHKRNQPVIAKGAWVWQTFLSSLPFLSAGAGLGWFLSVRLAFSPRIHVSSQRYWDVLWFLLAAGLAKMMQLFLKSFVGDVAVYTNADAKAKNYLIRKAILAGSTNAVIRLLREEDVVKANDTYDQVIVAGHSLGSVIAYDTLNELLNKRESREDQLVGHVPAKTEVTQDHLNKIAGLVTFGSPLDKVHYFFRQNVPRHQALRAQLLQFLQSFRKLPSNADYGIYRLQRYDATGLNGVLWLNAWSKQDPVSGALHFYTGLTRRHFEYRIPIYAHLSYWEDLRFYEFFAEPLLLGNQATLRQKAMGAAV